MGKESPGQNIEVQKAPEQKSSFEIALKVAGNLLSHPLDSVELAHVSPKKRQAIIDKWENETPKVANRPGFTEAGKAIKEGEKNWTNALNGSARAIKEMGE